MSKKSEVYKKRPRDQLQSVSNEPKKSKINNSFNLGN